MPTAYQDNVFINCPFDSDYKPIFDAIVFVVHDAGFVARCALEISNAALNRFEKILNIINECRFGIHDISRTEVDPTDKLPRFNMPLELGLYLGGKRFGNKAQQTKSCVIFDREPYRYQKFISDIAGQDIYSHNNNPQDAVGLVRNWLTTESKHTGIPGKAVIWKRYEKLKLELPGICRNMNIEVDELTLVDFTHIVTEWLKLNPL